ncbi:biopolymer transport protein ExbD [Hasllibacter halocynthiae]|uniref:Biopolymer transport protein ExbD n=1 Tax=Hasllibacter halocynthiae TaxID=595589 RepID=A0A2T0X1R9_9RHOB|nr:biopolymer transporter ExbD [Hasllibacter halocynthiae]PRY92881.1 biopolymer transport protein ExbD [Hasllibacter halocynthiae]
MRGRPRPRPRRRAEPAVALINVVFLMLIFFLVAGQVAPPPAPGLALPSAGDLERAPPPDALALHADGRVEHRGAGIAPEDFVAGLGGAPARIAPDRSASARDLVALAAALVEAGAPRVLVVGERKER